MVAGVRVKEMHDGMHFTNVTKSICAMHDGASDIADSTLILAIPKKYIFVEKYKCC